MNLGFHKGWAVYLPAELLANLKEDGGSWIWFSLMEVIGCFIFLPIRQVFIVIAFNESAVRRRPTHKKHLQGQARPKTCSMTRQTPCYIYEGARILYVRFAWRNKKWWNTDVSLCPLTKWREENTCCPNRLTRPGPTATGVVVELLLWRSSGWLAGKGISWHCLAAAFTSPSGWLFAYISNTTSQFPIYQPYSHSSIVHRIT